MLADLVHEPDTVDCAQLALSLEAIGALTHMGVQCTAQAHARMCWEKSRDAGEPGRANDEFAVEIQTAE